MLRFGLVTFGCQMNEHDSSRVREVLASSGLAEAGSLEEADVVVLNTCSVREKAEQKLRSEIGRWGVHKRRNPGLLLVVAGCVAQQEGEALLRKWPQIDLVIGPDSIAELPRLLAEAEGGSPPRAHTGFDLAEPRFLRAHAEPGQCPPSAYVTVMKGCDERCSFCIVPHTRGPERYRPAPEILEEIARLVAAGTKEVTLLGQTVNSYVDPARSLLTEAGRGSMVDDESEFPRLLRAIACTIPSLPRLRYTSPHPRHLTRSLIEAHRDLAVLSPHLHLPVQSGSDRVLKRMIRRHTVAEYLERVTALREAVAGVTLSTDIIVGFPGETERDFEQTLALVEQVGFVGLFGFKYSPRPFTPALKLGDDVSEEQKKSRLAALFALSERLKQAHLDRLVGSRQRILVEGPGLEHGFTGRTERSEIVHLGCKDDPTGEILDVTIVAAFKNSLAGCLLDSNRALPLARRLPAASLEAAGSPRTLPVV